MSLAYQFTTTQSAFTNDHDRDNRKLSASLPSRGPKSGPPQAATSASKRTRRTSETGRRQNRSCDQCRKGKRACDATLVNVASSTSDAASSISPASTGSAEQEINYLTPAGPCSYCTKTGKECTYEWLCSVQRDAVVRRPKVVAEEKAGRGAVATGRAQSGRRDIPHTGSNGRARASEPQVNVDGLLMSNGVPQFYPSSGAESTFVSDDSPDFNDMSLANLDNGNQFLDPQISFDLDPRSYGMDTGVDMSFDPTLVAPTWNGNGWGMVPGMEMGNDVGVPLDGFDVSSSIPEEEATQPTSKRVKRSRQLYGRHERHEPSPDALHHRIAATTNRSLIRNGLIRIYHDSMENALSCWLTEKTCPYNIEIPLSGFQLHPESMRYEWGPNWSNRICARVCRLDRAASVIRDRPLTMDEDRAASKALRTVIMSFATQWAQASKRADITGLANQGGDFKWELDGGEPPSSHYADSSDTSFDRAMQENLWHEARQALHETAGIESFRVIFAHIIFALTQRPLEVERHVKLLNSKGGSVSSDLEHITGLEGPPLFLETASRQVFSLRCKLEQAERDGKANMQKEGFTADGQMLSGTADPLSPADRSTFNLLFWLAVMFDTLSSVMYQRPLVVSDEDSDILDKSSADPRESEAGFDDDLFGGGSLSYNSTSYQPSSDNKLWGRFFMEKNSQRRGHPVTRWPCTYDEAAALLCDAAPVKVLLYRRVARLQTLLYRRARPTQLETAIADALSVYQHWNTTYGPFIRDCAAQHESLPVRIQSWYVVLAGHWHLAALLLSDIIATIDDSSGPRTEQSLARKQSGLVYKLRRHNACAVADLGAAACPRDANQRPPSFYRAREFHAALNRAALLTEPWTEVLIRSFGKAGYVLLDWMPHGGNTNTGAGGADMEVEVLKARCGACVNALYHLGRKSDMALLAATALARALGDKCRGSTVGVVVGGLTGNEGAAGMGSWSAAAEMGAGRGQGQDGTASGWSAADLLASTEGFDGFDFSTVNF